MGDYNYDLSGTNDSFHLETRYMDTIIGQVQDLAHEMEESRELFSKQLQRTTEGWSGKARVEFDKKAHMLAGELTDISQSLYDIGDSLLDASEAYMEADTELSKALDGVTNRY